MGRIHVHEAGVKISGPRVLKLHTDKLYKWFRFLPKGMYFYFPHFSEVYVDNIKRKVKRLPEQGLTTQDNKKVRVGCVMAYNITNIEKWLVENETPDASILAEAAKVVEKWITSRVYETITAYSPEGRSDDSLSRAAQAEMGQDFGVRIEYLAIETFAESDMRSIHHSGITPVFSEEED